MTYTIGIPIKVLHEAKGLIVSVELKTGQTYRGIMLNIEDNMNMQLRDVSVMARDGQASNMETCFLRGSQIRFVQVPDNLRHAPLFKPPGSGRERPARNLAGAAAPNAPPQSGRY